MAKNENVQTKKGIELIEIGYFDILTNAFILKLNKYQQGNKAL